MNPAVEVSRRCGQRHRRLSSAPGHAAQLGVLRTTEYCRHCRRRRAVGWARCQETPRKRGKEIARRRLSVLSSVTCDWLDVGRLVVVAACYPLYHRRCGQLCRFAVEHRVGVVADGQVRTVAEGALDKRLSSPPAARLNSALSGQGDSVSVP